MVKIIADTTSVLPQSIAERYQISIMPQIIHFGEETYVEGVDMTIEDFLERLKTSAELPKTSAPPPEYFKKAFEEIVPTGENILCIHPSQEVSGTIRAATVAARDFPDADIRIIDSRLVGSPVGTLVQSAAEWAEEGLGVDEIEKRVRELMSRCRIYFLVASLEYLAKGGRIGGASALVGNALRIKPILTIKDGRVEPFLKERTMKRALGRLKSLVEENYPRDGQGRLTIMHSEVPEQAYALGTYFQEELSIPAPPVLSLPPAITTHAGPGTLAVGFFEK